MNMYLSNSLSSHLCHSQPRIVQPHGEIWKCVRMYFVVQMQDEKHFDIISKKKRLISSDGGGEGIWGVMEEVLLQVSLWHIWIWEERNSM